VRGKHNKLGEGERNVRSGQDSLPNRPKKYGKHWKLAESSDVVLPALLDRHLALLVNYTPAFCPFRQ
jgi:hypothetical protein